MNSLIEIEIKMRRAVRFIYTNYKGDRGIRRIIPEKISFDKTPYYPRKGWLLHGFDLDKKEIRVFSMEKIEGPLIPLPLINKFY